MTSVLASSPAAVMPVLTLVDPDIDAVVDPKLDVGELSVEDLGSRIVGLAGRLAAATCQWLLLVAQFDARDGCARFGLASTARWLTHCCGLSHRAAVDHVRVARALAGFPQLASAMSAGRVSYSHVRAIARVAEPGEGRTVDDLLDVAESGTVGQLETIVRGLRTVEDLADGDRRPEEYVRTGWASNSQWQLGARLDPARGALVQKAIEAMRAAEGSTVAEALERIAEVALVVLADAGQAPALRGEERAAVILHLDLATARAVAGVHAVPAAERAPEPEPAPDSAPAPETEPESAPESEPAPAAESAAEPAAGPAATSDGTPEAAPEAVFEATSGAFQAAAARDASTQAGAGGRTATKGAAALELTAVPTVERSGARIQGGPGVPAAVVDRLLCDGRLRTSLHHADGSMFDLGRSRRVVSKRLFRALLDRDGCCTHPGCHSRAGLEAHHVRHWLYGGRTDLANLVLLCRRHHHAHHHDEFSIGIRPDGSFVFRRPDGRVLEQHVDPERLMPAAPAPLAAVGRPPRWTGTGDRLDRHYAVAVLAQRRENAARLAG